jgi:hypothetical protein
LLRLLTFVARWRKARSLRKRSLMDSVERTPKLITPEILAYCQEIGGTHPVFVRTTGTGKPFQCFSNAIFDVESNGGTITLGWKIWELQDVYLRAAFHTVSERGGKFFDTTPLPRKLGTHLFSPIPGATLPDSQADVPIPTSRNLCGHRLIDRAIECDRQAMELQRQGKENTVAHARLSAESRRCLNVYLARRLQKQRRKRSVK